MKLKHIIAFALIATLASCTLNFRLKKLEKACEEGDAEKAIEILETLEEKYDKPKHWTHEQTNRLSDAIEDLDDEMSSRDREKHSKDIYEVYRDILENLD